MKRNRLLGLLTSLVPLAVLPIAASCSTKKENKTTSAGFQESVLKQNLTKNNILTRVSNQFLETFYGNEVATLTEDEKASDPIKVLINKPSSQLFNDIKKVFKFYADQKLKENPQFFWSLRSNYINANVDTTDFNPTPFAIPTDDQLKFMLNNSEFIETDIRLDLQKRLLVYNYLLKNRDEYRNLANDSSGRDLYQLSLKDEMNKKETADSVKDLYNALNFQDNSLYLIKYLIDNPKLEEWSFTDDRDMNLRWGQANVSSFAEFNALASYNPSATPQYDFNPPIKNPDLLIATGSSEGQDVLKTLLAYKGLTANTSSGELSGTLANVKADLSSVFGFVDPRTNRVYSQDSFKFAKILAQVGKPPKAKKDGSFDSKLSEKKLDTLAAEDIQFEGLNRDSINKNLFTKQITVDQTTYTLQYKINALITFDGQAVTIPVRLSVKELGARNYYDYSAKLKYTESSNSVSEVDLPNFNLDKYPQTVDMIKDNKIQAKYVIKISPLYRTETVKEGDQDVSKEVLTFNGTPWESATQQENIALTIATNDADNLYREAVKYFKFLGFKFDEQKMNRNVTDILKIEGLI
ncbi:HinT-interacting membrane complex lipoprotein P60 [Mycoplasma struthionis]|uniref:P60-like lipoprotein n=1 Tax=Mycoplasma struthionis TaxID=538220 RepID=A0A3G8LHF8_9MOLU|nr:hypothetical protein [Mycoplasma struthionis]AZG68665.1 hypothetical protein EGN60_01640 [Mycoplasma struthionis]